MPRRIRLSVWTLTEMPNSAKTHCAKSTSRQRTTPSTAGFGPASTICFRASRCSAFNSGRLPGALPSMSPGGPLALNASTQSLIVWTPTPPIFATSLPTPAGAGSGWHPATPLPTHVDAGHRSPREAAPESAWHPPTVCHGKAQVRRLGNPRKGRTQQDLVLYAIAELQAAVASVIIAVVHLSSGGDLFQTVLAVAG